MYETVRPVFEKYSILLINVTMESEPYQHTLQCSVSNLKRSKIWIHLFCTTMVDGSSLSHPQPMMCSSPIGNTLPFICLFQCELSRCLTLCFRSWYLSSIFVSRWNHYSGLWRWFLCEPLCQVPKGRPLWSLPVRTLQVYRRVQGCEGMHI